MFCKKWDCLWIIQISEKNENKVCYAMISPDKKNGKCTCRNISVYSASHPGNRCGTSYCWYLACATTTSMQYHSIKLSSSMLAQVPFHLTSNLQNWKEPKINWLDVNNSNSKETHHFSQMSSCQFIPAAKTVDLCLICASGTRWHHIYYIQPCKSTICWCHDALRWWSKLVESPPLSHLVV